MYLLVTDCIELADWLAWPGMECWPGLCCYDIMAVSSHLSLFTACSAISVTATSLPHYCQSVSNLAVYIKYKKYQNKIIASLYVRVSDSAVSGRGTQHNVSRCLVV